MHRLQSILVLFALILFNLTLAGCPDDGGKNEQQAGPQKTLLLYCGTTIRFPMQELVDLFEKKEGCKIVVQTAGSGKLLKMIRQTRTGDLFSPTMESYIKTTIKEGMVKKEDTIEMGYNQAVLMVKKGNPMSISADIANLKDKQYRVMLGSFSKGSIGKQTRKVLLPTGITEDVINNTVKFVPTSKQLIEALKNNEADLVLNWKAAASNPAGVSVADVLDLDPSVSPQNKIAHGVLSYSEYPELAHKFLQLIASPQGQETFRKFGLL